MQNDQRQSQANHGLCFFFNDTATTEIYTLSLHDALPISAITGPYANFLQEGFRCACFREGTRSEEHTSELQSHHDLVCRLLLEKNKTPEDPTHRRLTELQQHKERRLIERH